jgi:hypothetical protein
MPWGCGGLGVNPFTKKKNYMLQALAGKTLISAAISLLVGVVAGVGLQQKFFTREHQCPKPVPCPTVVCPEAVTIQPFDSEKIKNVRSFTYAPQFTGTVSVAGVDSTSIRKFIDQSVMRAFEAHVQKVQPKEEKKKRRIF